MTSHFRDVFSGEKQISPRTEHTHRLCPHPLLSSAKHLDFIFLNKGRTQAKFGVFPGFRGFPLDVSPLLSVEWKQHYWQK